ncbi:MAG: glycine--tRNA ligase subunit beta, partial [Pseudomonadota bacterium]|nr:glycine--tRNA ligase subunit beta [Pseudomonadota bacterium]
KLDTLIGFWAIDEKPTGSKDPFALRRAALGVIRLLNENKLLVSLEKVLLDHGERVLPFTIASAQENGATLAEGPLASIREQFDIVALARNEKRRVTLHTCKFDADEAADLLSFLHDRLKVHLREQGIRHDIIDAVLAQEGNDDLVRVVARATALNGMLDTEDGRNLTQGLKRASNILAQAEEKDGVEYSFGADPKFAETDEERGLFTALDTAEPKIKAAMAAEDYPAAMTAIAALRAPIDAFFEAVQVNTDNQIVRRNRLNLLSRIREAGRQIADFGSIEG